MAGLCTTMTGELRIITSLLMITSLTLLCDGAAIPADNSTNSSEPVIRTNILKDVTKANKDLAAAAARAYSASKKMLEELQKENKISMIMSRPAFENVTCRLKPVSPYLSDEIRATVKDVKLLEYRIAIANYSAKDNPLINNLTYMYKGNQWNRISHSHGQTILNLAFNYGVLSLMTLSFGVATMDVEVFEEPRGCMEPMTEDQKAHVVLNLLLRDFDADGPLTVLDGQFVCNQVIKNVNGYAKFTDQCCFAMWPNYDIVCTVDLDNRYLKIMDVLIAIVSLAVFFFGPMAFTSMFYARTLDIVKYKVKLKEPLYKTLCVCKGEPLKGLISDFVLDLRNTNIFTKTKKMAKALPLDTVLPIKIDEYNIQINYMKLLPESEVPVGVLQSIPRAIFFCKLNEVDAFTDCCEANAFGCMRQANPIPWQHICNVIGRLLLVICLPLPYYIRLVMYYLFEHPEVVNRLEAVERLEMSNSFEYRILPYLTPTHPVLIGLYIIYFAVSLTMAILSTFNTESKFQNVAVEALHDLINMSWISALEMVIKNILWPFQKLGIFGILLCPIYWIVVIPCCLVVVAFYCIPMVFVSCRLLTHALGISTKQDRSKENCLPGELKRMPTGIQLMEADQLIDTLIEKNRCVPTRLLNQCAAVGLKECLYNVALAIICIATLCSIMVMLSEVVTYLLQVIIFTMMGIIVNAGSVLKYGTLIFLVVLYSYDCYNDVYEQYLKLNKALFSEIKGRIKEIMEYTSLPSHLQENRGFKSQEASEQADYEETDNISKDNPFHWDINDLILFIDNDDIPRIPKKLFEEVCQIRVPGSPGPVYLSLLAATGKFLFIVVFLMFVFIVVMSFGDVYRLSSTNQMLATMAGGFMPMIFSNILKPKRPEIELGSVSFRGKLEEVMINFWQTWPMFDFPFCLEEKKEEEPEDDDGSDSDKEKGKDKNKKDKKDKDKDKKKEKEEEKTEEEEELTEEKVQELIRQMKTVRPAEGQYVDLTLILDDKDDEEGLLEWGSSTNLAEEIFGRKPHSPASPSDQTPIVLPSNTYVGNKQQGGTFFVFTDNPNKTLHNGNQQQQQNETYT